MTTTDAPFIFHPALTPSTLQEFETLARDAGFDEVAVREWGPDEVVATHTHPFSVKALVVQGEMALTDGEGAAAKTRLLHSGDWFELRRGAPHAERYGPEGATYWAARRHQAG